MATLKCQPFVGVLGMDFLAELARRKLHDYGLSDAPVDIRGCFSRAERVDMSSPFTLDSNAFAANDQWVPATMSSAPGTLRNANTLEDFKDIDKNAVLNAVGDTIWADITSGAALAKPELLLRFLLLTFADLKSHRYYYWFGFPALVPAGHPPAAEAPIPLGKLMLPEQMMLLREGFAKLSASGSGCAPPFFAVRLQPGGALEVGPLKAFKAWAAATDGSEAWLAFCDPCGLGAHGGWPMRNLLALAAVQQLVPPGASYLRILCYREPQHFDAAAASSAARLGMPAAPSGGADEIRSILIDVQGPLDGAVAGAPRPKVTGWALNANGKAAPRLMDVSNQMNPEQLAEQSVDLNLRLMRWRLMPQLNNEAIAASKCLLIGAGTLGCAVARCLLGWGVRTITLVDSGIVSYSNPVRQSLFNFEDCVGGDTPKAQAAADALKRIFPAVNATAHRVGIPMPGHAVGSGESAQIEKDVAQLEELVRTHDIIYLLTDTRESRWLPTLLAARHRKLAITVALGFDALVVMRHGVTPPAGGPPHLGCYFCNDVVAPANSMIKRTLDQQCTVSRPGLSMVASALAVELMVTLMHHPQGSSAQADLVGDDESAAGPDAPRSPLGGVPHQVRATLPLFRTACLSGSSFDKCTACSGTVLSAYGSEGFPFLLKAFNSSTYLEDLTGLTQMKAEAEAALESMQDYGNADEGEGDDDF